MSQFTAFVFAACVAFAAPAFADPPSPQAVSVRSDDLDLTSERGAAMMLRRLEHAADQVCGRSTAQAYPSQREAYRECRARTVAASVARLDADTVRDLHAARYGTQPVQTADR